MEQIIWTNELIASLSMEEYNKHRKDIREFYNQFIPVKEQIAVSDIPFLTQEQIKANKYYWKNHPNLKIYNIYKDNPWCKHFTSAKARCESEHATGYIDYGFLGIECKITQNEVKKLWFRDDAWEMNDPTIDRKDALYHYTYDNCQFLERIDNSKKARKEYRNLKKRRNYNSNGDWIQLI